MSVTAFSPAKTAETMTAPVDFNLDGVESRLAGYAKLKRIKAGENLYVEGDESLFCYQVVSGLVKEYATLEDGRRQVADFYGPGELFGVSELHEQIYTAEAIAESVVRLYPREAFLRSVSSHPPLAYAFLDMLMTRLHRTRERVVVLGRMSAVQRVACFLIRLSTEQNTTHNIKFMMSRQDIADHLGLTIETVCRALTELKKKGVIAMPTARLFSIVDEASLRNTPHKPCGFH